ncbi:disks large homolog 5-like isoform X2 [Peromyscus eremicus]|uniref:disks large homolog 5-like isoform X2 n=1 Tax=Peromyscus eremicus TaxID=42410 RepID=UPI0027DB8320|nr:disks large homolog 5-like isoform X2 [Peromyscus eremicus]
MLSRLRGLFGRGNGLPGETRVTQKEAGHRSPWKTWKKWSWGRGRTTGKTPTQTSTSTEQEQQMTKLEKLTLQLQSITYERIELHGILTSYTDMDLQNRLNSFGMLKKEHKQVMSALQKLPMEISDDVNKVKQLIEENVSYSYLHSQVLRDWTQRKESVHVLRLKNRQLWKEQIELHESCEELKRLLKEAHEMICDPSAEQQQGSCEITGRKQPSRTRAQCQCQEQKSLDERLKDLLKQKELVTQQEDLAEKLQHHFSVSEIRSENLQSELEQATAQDESLLQTELLQQEH